MEATGRHALIELRDCNPAKLDDLPFIRTTLLEAAEEVGATVIDDIFHQFSPQGVTGVVAIAESHLSIHTWPEFGYGAMDVFTCGTGFEVRAVAEFVIRKLECKNPEVIEITRGPIEIPRTARI